MWHGTHLEAPLFSESTAVPLTICLDLLNEVWRMRAGEGDVGPVGSSYKCFPSLMPKSRMPIRGSTLVLDVWRGAEGCKCGGMIFGGQTRYRCIRAQERRLTLQHNSIHQHSSYRFSPHVSLLQNHAGTFPQRALPRRTSGLILTTKERGWNAD